MRTASLALTFVALSGALLACSGADADSVASSTDEVIGGSPADGAEFDAVVEVLAANGGMCSGVLVTPSLVLTAAHCVENFDQRGQVRLNTVYVKGKPHEPKLVVQVGPDGNKDAIYERSVVDAALLVLAEPVPASEAKPIPIRESALGQADLGTKLTVVGYGQTTQSQPAQYAQRKRVQGTVTLNAVDGKPFQQAYATFADFQDYLRAQGEPASFVDGERAKELWEAEIDPASELAHAGGRRGDAQGCYGDSGGPLLERVNGAYRVVGLVSSGDEGSENMCLAGEYFVRLGELLRARLEAFASEDPGANGCLDAPRRSQGAYAFDTAAVCVNEQLVTCRWSGASNSRAEKETTRVEACPSGTRCTKVPGVNASCTAN